MMQNINFKSNSGQFNIDEAQGIVECFVAGIGNKDSVGDIVISGAFAKSLIRRKPRVVWGHNWNDPIGKVLEIYEVAPNDSRLPSKMKSAGVGGLYAKVQFNLNSEKGREAFTNVAFFGEEQEWSIGYKTLDAIFDNSRQANVLREVELYELSPVLHGANQLTGTISVKSDSEKMHMSMMGGPSAVVAEEPDAPIDPFAQGIAQPASSDRSAALERELATRTNGPVKIMKATESSVVFMKPGKGVFRLGYYFDGEQYMFGKPEKMGSPMVIVGPGSALNNPGPRQQRIPNFPAVQGKPSTPMPTVPVKYGSDAAANGFFDLDDEKSLAEQLSEQPNLVEQLSGIVGSLQHLISQHQMEKSELIVSCAPEYAFEVKQALDPLFDYHRIETYVSEDGIVIASPLSEDAYDAVENATKALFGRIGRGIGGGGKKVRRGRTALAEITGITDPRKRRDIDGDGLIFDGTWMEQPDPSRAIPRMRGLRSEGGPPSNVTPGDGPASTPKKPKFASSLGLTGNEKPRIDINFTRAEKVKLLKMLDSVIGENQLTDDNPIVKLRDSIKNAKKVGEMIQPALFEGDGTSLLNSVQQEFEKLLPSFEKYGSSEPGKRGRSPSDILRQVLTDKKYTRTNIDKRAKGGVGNASARQGVAQGKRTNIVGRPGEKLPVLGPRRNNVMNVDDFIKKEFLPSNWYEMNGEEKLKWLNSAPDGAGNEGSNEEALIGLRPDSFDWAKLIRRITGEAIDQSMAEDPEARDEELQDKRRVRLERVTQPTAAQRNEERERKIEKDRVEKREAAVKKRLEKEKSTAEATKAKRGVRQFETDPDKPDSAQHAKAARRATDRLEKVRVFVDRQTEAGNIDKKFADIIKEALDDFDIIIADESDVPDSSSIKDGMEKIESLIKDLEDPKITKTQRTVKKKNKETGKEETEVEEVSSLTKKEQETIEGLKTISGGLSEHISEMEERESELDANEDLLQRESERMRMSGGSYDTDENEVDNGDEETGYRSGNLRSAGRARPVRIRDLGAVIDEARQFRTTYANRRSSRSLRSSGSVTPRTEIIKESTWWKEIDSSLTRELSKAENDIVKNGLTLLQQKISKYKAGAFKPDSKRTNVGSIKISADEADKILDAVMSVIDRQMTAGRGGTAGSRGEIFAELLEALSSAAMSTFIDKTGPPSD